MRIIFRKNLSALVLTLILLSMSCSSNQETVPRVFLAANAAPVSATAPPNQTIRFLEERIKKDPEDFIALNKLASEYLQQMRETGDANYLNLAERASTTSLSVLPAEQNKEGLSLLTLVKFSLHEFSESRDYAKQLIQLEPNKGYAYQMLGDALLELGEYEQAEVAFQEMKSLGGIQVFTQAAMEQRFARLAWLKGNIRKAKTHFSKALELVRSMPEPPAETDAYCSWQLGEIAFSAGDYPTAEKHYDEAIKTFPGYIKALGSKGKVRAARGDISSAIELYEKVVKRLPEISSIAALGDLYKFSGRDEDAKKQYELVEQIGILGGKKGTLNARNLAFFYADHGLNTEEAYQMAANEYETRRDIYGSAALAWTALKSGKLVIAQEKSKEALRLGTLDANLFYHAGMIALASGDYAKAKEYLQRALARNPKFDLLKSDECRKMLKNIS